MGSGDKKTTPTMRDPVNQVVIDVRDAGRPTQLGLMSDHAWKSDPKRLLFSLSRYKFVAKMLAGKKRVFEIGCSDGFFSRIVRQEVEHLTVTDFDPVFIEDIKANMDPAWAMDTRVHNILDGPVGTNFDGGYALDVFEHIAPEHDQIVWENLAGSLTEHGVAVIGMPTLESQAHASKHSRDGHINCKSGEELRHLAQQHFHNVFMFSMNDEVVHTGFFPMAHYIFAVCAGKRL